MPSFLLRLSVKQVSSLRLGESKILKLRFVEMLLSEELLEGFSSDDHEKPATYLCGKYVLSIGTSILLCILNDTKEI